MLWHKRQQYPDKEWVFLVLGPSILWEKPCLFYPTNAASNTVRFCDESLFTTPEALENLFSGERSGLADCLPTDVQAEIMVQGVIEPSYIRVCLIDSLQQANWEQKLSQQYPSIRFIYGGKNFNLFMGFREKIKWS